MSRVQLALNVDDLDFDANSAKEDAETENGPMFEPEEGAQEDEPEDSDD